MDSNSSYHLEMQPNIYSDTRLLIPWDCAVLLAIGNYKKSPDLGLTDCGIPWKGNVRHRRCLRVGSMIPKKNSHPKSKIKNFLSLVK